MGELKFNDESVGYLALAIIFQLVTLLVPAFTSFVPAIVLAVLAGLQFNALTGFIIGFAGLLVAGFLTGTLTSAMLLQCLLVGFAGIIGGAVSIARPASRNDLLTLSVVAAIAYEIASNLIFVHYGLTNPLNPFYYFDAPALSSAVNILACLVLAVILSYAIGKK